MGLHILSNTAEGIIIDERNIVDQNNKDHTIFDSSKDHNRSLTLHVIVPQEINVIPGMSGGYDLDSIKRIWGFRGSPFRGTRGPAVGLFRGPTLGGSRGPH